MAVFFVPAHAFFPKAQADAKLAGMSGGRLRLGGRGLRGKRSAVVRAEEDPKIRW
jgi:hypothetical protein